MKKFIFIILVAISGSLAVVSCTEEKVEPTTSGNSGGQDQGGKI